MFKIQVQEISIDIDLALAGIRQDLELVAQIAADRAGIGAHRDCLQPHPRKGAQIGNEHLVVGVPGPSLIEVEAVIILHQEFAAAHHAKARAHLVAELPLDMIEVLRQIAVTLDRVADDRRYLFLVGRPVQHLAVVAVADAQHLLAVIVVPAALAPQLGRLDRRHQDFLRPGAVLLLADDLLDALQHAQAERQPGIDPGARLPDHAGAQHQAVRGDLRLARVFAQERQKILGQAHDNSPDHDAAQSTSGPAAKKPAGAKKPRDPVRRFAYYVSNTTRTAATAWSEFREVS